MTPKEPAQVRLLAIDDDAWRYQHLKRLLEPMGIVVDVMCCDPCCRSAFAVDYAAVLLDHDLYNNCAECCVFTKGNTRHLVAEVARMGVPVVVTSASSKDNRQALRQELQSHEATFTMLSAMEPDPELKWIGWLWLAGCLPGAPE